jgi:hypothetical protein
MIRPLHWLRILPLIRLERRAQRIGLQRLLFLLKSHIPEDILHDVRNGETGALAGVDWREIAHKLDRGSVESRIRLLRYVAANHLFSALQSQR